MFLLNLALQFFFMTLTTTSQGVTGMLLFLSARSQKGEKDAPLPACLFQSQDVPLHQNISPYSCQFLEAHRDAPLSARCVLGVTGALLFLSARSKGILNLKFSSEAKLICFYLLFVLFIKFLQVSFQPHSISVFILTFSSILSL